MVKGCYSKVAMQKSKSGSQGCNYVELQQYERSVTDQSYYSCEDPISRDHPWIPHVLQKTHFWCTEMRHFEGFKSDPAFIWPLELREYHQNPLSLTVCGPSYLVGKLWLSEPSNLYKD